MAARDEGRAFVLEPYPDRRMHVIVLDDVSNAAEVSAWVRQPGADFAAVDARMVVGMPQLLAAALCALHAEQRGKLVTHALHSEVVYALSAGKQINEAFRRFGAGESCARIVIVTFDAGAAARLSERILGRRVDPLSLAERFDEAAVRKAYKVTEAELRVASLSDAIVSRIAIQRL